METRFGRVEKVRSSMDSILVVPSIERIDLVDFREDKHCFVADTPRGLKRDTALARDPRAR